MNRFRLFVLLVLGSIALLKAQKKLIVNIMIDDYAEKRVEVMVTNLNNHMKFYSIDDHLQIIANAGDSLLFESDITQARKLMVTDEMYNNGKFTVHLNMFVIQLKDVNASNLLTGNIQEDLKSTKIENNDSINDALRVPITRWDASSMQREIHIKPINGELPSQVDFVQLGKLILNIFNIKLFKPKTKNVTVTRSINEIRAFLGDTFFEDMGISISEIDYFLKYCQTIDENQLQNSYLEVIQFLSEQVESYQTRDTSVITL